jgi:hypothetical protein
VYHQGALKALAAYLFQYRSHSGSVVLCNMTQKEGMDREKGMDMIMLSL